MVTIANSKMIMESLNPKDGDILIVRTGQDQIKDTYFNYIDGKWVEYGLEVTTPAPSSSPVEEEECKECEVKFEEEPAKPAPKKRSKKKE